MVKIKICGITELDDAKAAVAAGCDAVGFVFYKKSPRYITPHNAKEIIKRLPKRINKIGVFVNSREKNIKRIVRLCAIDMLQLHGSESAQFCKRFKGYKIIKAFRVKDKIDLQNILRYKTSAYLFDTYVRSKPGGTGRVFDWNLLAGLTTTGRPIFLSGGLNERNVKRAIRILRPDWIDVCGSVEKLPGKKDPLKIRRFISAVKKR